MKSNPAVPGGSLVSKPTWWDTFGCSATSAFFVLGDRTYHQTRRVPMSSVLCATIVQVAFALTGAEPAEAGPETYAEAHRVTTETGKPMVVMVCTDWCVPCQMMKKTVLPRLRQRGLFRRVSFATVNSDHDSDLAQKLTGGGPIPQLVMFRKTADGWKRQKLVGGQSVESVEKFINEGLVEDQTEKKCTAETGEKNSPDTDQTPER
jgi:thiol-disulfide isomerase/thioredoxin